MRFRLLLPCLLLALTACNVPASPAPTATLLPSPRLEDIQTALAGTLTALPTLTSMPSPTPIANPTTTPSLPTPIPPSEAPAAEAPTQAPLPEAATPVAPGIPAEAILILEPGVTSRVTSPVRLSGMADPTFEQNLVVQVIGQDGTVLAQTPTAIAADAGQRGPFAVDLAFSITADQPGRLVVYTDSPRGGRITHLASVEVTLLASGSASLASGQPHDEEIVISEPPLSATISGGVVHVAGFAGPTFENNLVIEVQDAEGNAVGSAPATIQSPDIGQPGPFAADVAYTVASEQAGRIVVYHVSARDGGELHLNSVEIALAP